MLRKVKSKLSLIRSAIFGVYHNFFEPEETIIDLVKKIKVGLSIQGREIFVYRFGTGQTKIIFVSAIHGNEVGTVKLAKKLINLISNTEKDFKGFSFYIVPYLNPDGFELARSRPQYWQGGRIGRFNANQVDLNRNFKTSSWHTSSIWSSGQNYSQKDKVFCGSSAGSEPEVIALCDLIKRENIKIFFSFHNVGRDVMPSSDNLASKIAEIYCQQTGFSFISTKEWQQLSQTGTAREWCEENNISYIEIECPYRWGSDWDRQSKAILNILKYLTSLV
jgi:predicted deacylase